MTSVTLPAHLGAIPADAFYNCNHLTSITIPANVSNIGQNAFGFCSALTNVNLPNGLIVISADAFYACGHLVDLTLPTNVVSIGADAFYGCARLTGIGIPASVNNIGASPFADCIDLVAVTVDTNNASFSSVNGILFGASNAAIIQYPDGLSESYAITNTVTSLGQYSFAYSALTSVTIPASVTKIGTGAFFDCPDLTSIIVASNNPSYSSVGGVLFDKGQDTLIQFPGGLTGSYAMPGTVTTIGPQAFAYSGLTGIAISTNVTYIASNAFEFCSGLTSVTIPASVSGIGLGAFYACANLKKVYFEGNAPTFAASVFQSDNGVTVYYPAGALGWDSFSAGPPAVQWNPVIQVGGASFGVRSNLFGFNVTGTTGIAAVVAGCTNLANPDWVPLQTVTLTNGSFYFTDPQWKSYSGRFYRLQLP